MDQLDLAIHDTTHKSEITAEEIAERMGVNYQTLLNKTNPSNESHVLKFREVVALVKNTANPAIIRVMAESIGYALVRTNDAEPRDLMTSILDVAAEHGDVAKAVNDALSDGVISDREQAEIKTKIDHAIGALEILRSAVTESARGDLVSLQAAK